MRTKNYEMIDFLVRDRNNAAIRDAEVIVRGVTTIATRTDGEGKIEIPVALDGNGIHAEQLSIAGHKVASVVQSPNENAVIVAAIQTSSSQLPPVEKPAPVDEEYF